MIEIKYRFTGDVLYNIDVETLRGADLREENLRGADLRGADLRGTDLRWADLRWADLRRADLRGTDFRRADFRGADLYGVNLLILQLEQYTVYVQPDNTRIECRYHPSDDWLKWSPENVAHMEDDAKAWWEKYQGVVKAAIRSLK